MIIIITDDKLQKPLAPADFDFSSTVTALQAAQDVLDHVRHFCQGSQMSDAAFTDVSRTIGTEILRIKSLRKIN